VIIPIPNHQHQTIGSETTQSKIAVRVIHQGCKKIRIEKEYNIVYVIKYELEFSYVYSTIM